MNIHYANLIEGAIPLFASIYIIFMRKSLTARILDPIKKARMEKFFLVLGPVLLVFGVLQCGMAFFAEEKIDLVAIAEEVNKKLPIMADEITRCDSVEVGGKNKLIFNYTVLKKIEDLDENDWKTQVTPILKKNALANENVKLIAKKNILLHFRYFDKDKKLLCEFDVDE